MRERYTLQRREAAEGTPLLQAAAMALVRVGELIGRSDTLLTESLRSLRRLCEEVDFELPEAAVAMLEDDVVACGRRLCEVIIST